MTRFKEGDKVKITQIDKNYGNPWVGRIGTIVKVSSQVASSTCYQVGISDERDPDLTETTLTLFDNELELA